MTKEELIGTGETISYKGKTYKINTTKQRQTIPPKTRVEIRQTLDGKLFVWYKELSLAGNIQTTTSDGSPKRKGEPCEEPSQARCQSSLARIQQT
ncbi:hypothetical protein [Thermicanus aegyptius]|uniref:hypothetical protein n=1 Tax=Thermicanus aegyptius TaxID=94009 RepID=UPI00048E305A|nr:hypothetical protein [Thermicanus aegyptius]